MTTIFHNALLGQFRTQTYSELLDHHHLDRSTAKLFEFKETLEHGARYTPLQGFSLIKDNVKYLIEKEKLEMLPLRILKTTELNTSNNDVVQVITEARSFRVRARADFTFKQLIDMDGLVHSTPEQWTLWKIVCWAARLARINIRASANPGFGKTSYFNILHHIVNSTYVLAPRSVPGMAQGFTEKGVLVLDEMGKMTSDIRLQVECCILKLGEFSAYVTLGTAGSLAYNTKAKYNTPHLSLVCLFNRLGDYQDEREFFDFMWSNNKAMNNRLLPLKMDDGNLDTMQFIESSIALTEEIKEKFYGIMRSCEYYQQGWINQSLNINEAAITHYLTEMKKKHKLAGRHLLSFRTILCFIYLYAESDENAFKLYADLLSKWYGNYLAMVGYGEQLAFHDGKLIVHEEKIE